MLLSYDRAVLAGAVVREKLRTATATAVRGRAYDVAAHQQAAMPEQLLAHQDADPGPDRPEPETEPQAAIYLTALRNELWPPDTTSAATSFSAPRQPQPWSSGSERDHYATQQ
ncbi:hypothetical protein ACFTXM_05285 [Streptomyces sp. NPDC056930]|uniref:hypothetical protein n=1 Tax=Streptomyces sp. NPDC056930 TaxID=3345967 RepID=UPI0036363CFD